MPNLQTSLQKYDLGHLRILAEFWGLELDTNEIESVTKEICASFLDPDLLSENLDVLPAEAKSALETLSESSGRIPWAEFTRQYGKIRETGPGKRDREQPHRNPTSTAEILFYRALLARAFFDTDNGPLEFAYIPDDLFKLIKRKSLKRQPAKKLEPLGRLALAREKGHILHTSDHILDEATTLLAALRIEMKLPATSVPVHALEGFLQAAKIILKTGPKPEAVKIFLENSRPKALKTLTDAWLESEVFNELLLVPGLIFEGEWKNQPLVTREFLFSLMNAIPKGKWWSLSAFIKDVKSKYPDFQRPSGDYDSWYIKSESKDEYLRGFEYWDQVDGALIHFFITEVLFWLGQVDIAAPEKDREPTAFRVVKNNNIIVKENQKLVARSNGQVSCPQLVPRVVRYQIARFCEWDESKAGEYQYRLTPASLKRAREQGLKVEHLLSLLAKHSSGGIPPVLVKALKRWDVNGTEARIQTQAILRVSRPEVLEELRKSRAGRFLGELLGPTAVIIKKGAQSKVLAALAELGLLAEEEKQSE